MRLSRLGLAAVFAATLVAPVARAAEPDKLLPAEADTVVFVNFKQILEADVVKKYALDQIKQALAGQDAKKLLEDMGLDPMKDIEKGIAVADLGFNPANDGVMIRLPVPELTEDRRKDMVKLARKMAEDGRIAVRNIRRDTMHDLRELKNEGEVGSDDEHRAEEALQKLTDTHVGEIDSLLAGKEAEILEV